MGCCDLPEDLRKVGIHRLHGCTTIRAMDNNIVCGSQWHFSNYECGVTLVDLNHQDDYYLGRNSIKDRTRDEIPLPMRIMPYMVMVLSALIVAVSIAGVAK